MLNSRNHSEHCPTYRRPRRIGIVARNPASTPDSKLRSWRDRHTTRCGCPAPRLRRWATSARRRLDEARCCLILVDLWMVITILPLQQLRLQVQQENFTATIIKGNHFLDCSKDVLKALGTRAIFYETYCDKNMFFHAFFVWIKNMFFG